MSVFLFHFHLSARGFETHAQAGTRQTRAAVVEVRARMLRPPSGKGVMTSPLRCAVDENLEQCRHAVYGAHDKVGIEDAQCVAQYRVRAESAGAVAAAETPKLSVDLGSASAYGP